MAYGSHLGILSQFQCDAIDDLNEFLLFGMSDRSIRTIIIRAGQVTRTGRAERTKRMQRLRLTVARSAGAFRFKTIWATERRLSVIVIE